jgi:hypothetical protein
MFALINKRIFPVTAFMNKTNNNYCPGRICKENISGGRIHEQKMPRNHIHKQKIP